MHDSLEHVSFHIFQPNMFLVNKPETHAFNWLRLHTSLYLLYTTWMGDGCATPLLSIMHGRFMTEAWTHGARRSCLFVRITVWGPTNQDHERKTSQT